MNTIGTIESGTIDMLFSTTSPQQDQYDALANNALSRGIGFYQQGNYERAAKEFQRSIGLSPHSSYTQTAYDYMVQSLLKLNRTDEAIKAYTQAIGLDPTNDSYHVNLGNIYFSLGRYDDAKSEYNGAVKLDPTSTLNWYSLGQAYMQTGNYAGAEQAFKTVNAYSPGEATFALGQIYHLMGRHDDAVAELKSAISVDKDFGYAYLELGYVYAEEGVYSVVAERLIKENYLCVTANNGREALRHLYGNDFSLIISDIKMPGEWYGTLKKCEGFRSEHDDRDDRLCGDRHGFGSHALGSL